MNEAVSIFNPNIQDLRRRKLLLFSKYPMSEKKALNRIRPFKTLRGINYQSLLYDPSTIFFSLPANKQSDWVLEPKLPISYTRLNPIQRGVYLNWLRDVSLPISENYALLYYFGLERYLLYGDSNDAQKEILYLRKYHLTNLHLRANSFISLWYSYVINKQYNSIYDLFKHYQNHYHGINIIMSFICIYKLNLSVEILFEMRPQFSAKINTRYIYRSPEYYLDILESVLMEMYGKPILPVHEVIDINQIDVIEDTAISNPSIPRDERLLRFADFRHDSQFNHVISTIFKLAHQKIKHSRCVTYGISTKI